MVGGLKMRKLVPYSGFQNPSSKLEMAEVKHQGLDRHVPGAKMYLIVSLRVPAVKLSSTRGVHGNLACLE